MKRSLGRTSSRLTSSRSRKSFVLTLVMTTTMTRKEEKNETRANATKETEFAHDTAPVGDCFLLRRAWSEAKHCRLVVFAMEFGATLENLMKKKK